MRRGFELCRIRQAVLLTSLLACALATAAPQGSPHSQTIVFPGVHGTKSNQSNWDGKQPSWMKLESSLTLFRQPIFLWLIMGKWSRELSRAIVTSPMAGFSTRILACIQQTSRRHRNQNLSMYPFSDICPDD
jgi:hypothetical protein